MAKPKAGQITAYCMKTKKKGVPMEKAVIDKNGARYFAKGVDSDGNKMCAALGEAAAKEAVKGGFAKKGKGW